MSDTRNVKITSLLDVLEIAEAQGVGGTDHDYPIELTWRQIKAITKNMDIEPGTRLSQIRVFNHRVELVFP